MARVYFEDNTFRNPHELNVGLQNIEKTGKMGLPQFNPSSVEESDAHTPVVIFGGGKTSLDEVSPGISRRDQFDANENIIKVAAGSAVFHLDPERARKGEGLKNGVDIAVFNGVDTPDDDSYYEKALAFQNVGYYMLASYNSPAAFKSVSGLSQAIRYNAVLGNHVYGENETVIGAGSTAPSAALALMILQGYRNFEFIGVDGAVFEQDFNPHEYQAYDMDEFKETPEQERAKEVIIAAGEQEIRIRRGQWFQLQELNNLVYAHNHDCTFKVHGHSLTALNLNQGVDVKMVFDPKGEVPEGTVTGGLSNTRERGFDPDYLGM